MKIRYFVFFLPLLFFTLPSLKAQHGFFIQNGRKQVEIPFEYVNNFIILNIRFHGILPSRFIFDTGAEFTILANRGLTDLMQMEYEQKFQVAGSDLNNPLTAYLVRRVAFTIPDKVYAESEDILVLEEDYFRFQEYAGVEVQGILSANAFSRYIIKINYQRHVIVLTDRASYKPPADFEEMPVEIFRNKIYLNTRLNVRSDSIVPVKLLLDTGAGLPLMLFTNTHAMLQPPPNAIPSDIGMGLGGFIKGYTGRINRLELNSFVQQEIITYFQEADTSRTFGMLNQRNGLLGNSILNHFHVIIDYQNSRIWFKPNKYYQEKFIFDRSGINVIASGDKPQRYFIHNVLPHSPAEEADIRVGDEILRIGNAIAQYYTLAGIQHQFVKKPGKEIRLTILRDGIKMRKRFVLRDLL